MTNHNIGKALTGAPITFDEGYSKHGIGCPDKIYFYMFLIKK